MVGYEYSEMKDVLVIVNAVNAYKSGGYILPACYYIPSDIPPKSLQPPAPDTLLPWFSRHTQSQQHAAPSTPRLRRSHAFSTTSGDRQGIHSRDINLNISLNGLTLSPSPSPSTPRGSTTERNNSSVRNNAQTPTPIPTYSSPGRSNQMAPQTRTDAHSLTRPMLEFLRLFYGFRKHDIETISAILQAPSRHSQLYPTL
jgi:hypothetical protein